MLRDGECIACEKCIGVCPKKNLTQPEKKLIKNELFLLVIKAALFFVMGNLFGIVPLLLTINL